jgi:glycosyltransferase involved in cell wall biosynthesis
LKRVPDLSVVVPARDEEENVAPLVEEVERVLGAHGVSFEMIVVDDGSRDATAARLAALLPSRPWLTALRLGAREGKSAALRRGFLEAKAPFVATLDADLQNDPADLVPMLEILRRGEADLVQGSRTRRADGFSRRLAAAVGRTFRRWVLGDPTFDTGCAARVSTAELARSLPLEFEGMHRFVAHLARRQGARVVEVPVSHRERRAGRGHYGLVARGAASFVDLFAVRWMDSRRRRPHSSPIEAERK